MKFLLHSSERLEQYTGVSRPHLRTWLLLPLLFILLSATVFVIHHFYEDKHKDISKHVIHVHQHLESTLKQAIAAKLDMLGITLATLAHDRRLQRSMIQRDRQALLRQTQALFREYKDTYHISHLYFTTPERINLLRVHQPERFGDRITRLTTQQAWKTGKVSHGLELGPLGTFSLRMVMPWFNLNGSGELVGFMELGLEFDQIIRQIQDNPHGQVYITLAKRYLVRQQWERGMLMLGKKPHWEQFPSFVWCNQDNTPLPGEVTQALQQGIDITAPEPRESSLQHAHHRLFFLPLRDAHNRVVGQLLSVVSVREQEQEVHQAAREMSLWLLLLGGLVFTLIYLLIRRVARRLQSNEANLADQIIRDSLTSLFNHNTFFKILHDELERARRYNRPLSLLMIDIDHFKDVNDNHGHMVGDEVLVKLARLLNNSARSVDTVCRYGGEEFAIILPETTLAMAMLVAERIRKQVRALLLQVATGKSLSITISLGVAELVQETRSVADLVSAADSALYQAKNSGRNRVCCFTPQ